MESMFKKARDMLIGSDGNDEDDENSEPPVDGDADDAEDTEEPPEDEDNDDDGEDGDKNNGDAAEDDNKQKSGKQSKTRSKAKSKGASRSTTSVDKDDTEPAKQLRQEWQDTAKTILDAIKSRRKAGEGNGSETGTPTRSTATGPASIDTHVCPKCEKKDSLGQFECALWTAGIYRKDDPNQFKDREKIYKDFQESQIPTERRFLNCLADKISSGVIPGNWLPGVGLGLSHDDWMKVGDNKLRTGGGEPARQQALADARRYSGGEKTIQNATIYELPPFVVEYLNDDRGFTWLARRFIPRGEEIWQEAAFTYIEGLDDDGMPVDCEQNIQDIYDFMLEDNKRHFKILPPQKSETDPLTNTKLGELTRVFRRWSIGCERDEPYSTSRVYSPGVAFLNHSCIPNAQQSTGTGHIVPSDVQKLDMLEQWAAKQQELKEKKRKAKDKEKDGEEGEEHDDDDDDDDEDEDYHQEFERYKEEVRTCTHVPHLTIFIRATKDIQPGTEITVQYITTFDTSDERHKLLNSNWGFQCTCDVCKSKIEAFDLVLTAVNRSRETRRFKNIRKDPVLYVRGCGETLWALISIEMWDIRYPRILEETGDMFAMISDNGRAFFFYMMAERIYESLLCSTSADIVRTRTKTNLLFQRHGKSKRGLSAVEDCLLLFLNEEYIMELLVMLGVKDKRYRRLPTYRKQHKWLTWYDRKKYIHERTQMELDKVVEWTAEWMEERLQSLYKHGNLKHCKQVERKRRLGLDKEEAEAEASAEEAGEAKEAAAVSGAEENKGQKGRKRRKARRGRRR